ncbi:MAG: septum formation initiator family protein [Acutalibacteraceae bacterium]|nr:septum formation initiator family protein [Acutalibacteraceae bacterium]
MRSKNNRRKKGKDNKKLLSFIISIGVIVFAFYAVVTLVNQQLKIAEKKEELESLKNEIMIQEVKNDDLNNVYNLEDSENDAYIERVAREEFDYSKQGERVFINIAGE